MSNITTSFSDPDKLLTSLTHLVPNEAHLHLDIANDFVLPENWEFKDRVNGNYHLAFVRSGSGCYEINGESIDFEPERFYLFTKHCKHSRQLNTTDLPRMTLLRFSLLNNKTCLPFLHHTDGQAITFVTSRPRVYYELFDKMLTYHKESSPTGTALTQIVLSQILYEMYRDALNMNQTANSRDPRLNKAYHHIQNQYDRKLSLSALADMAGLSRNHFLRCFKDAYGTSPKQLQIQLRIDHASRYLLETDMSILDISTKLGYEDQFSFSRQFREVTGVSPSRFRKPYIETELK